MSGHEPAAAGGPERHASWLELFFDLVVVAGIGRLAHLLAEDSTRRAGWRRVGRARQAWNACSTTGLTSGVATGAATQALGRPTDAAPRVDVRRSCDDVGLLVVIDGQEPDISGREQAGRRSVLAWAAVEPPWDTWRAT